MSTFAVKARYLFPVSSPPIAGGVLSIAQDRITAVGGNLSGAPPRDLGNVAIMPGLVNAHIHLEFSNLSGPLGSPGMRFTDWIRIVVEHRRQSIDQAADPSALRTTAVVKGLAETIAGGAAAVGEIATQGWPNAPFDTDSLQSTVFLELLGLRRERMEPLWQAAQDHVLAAARQTEWRAGLSPHAPYTVRWELLCRVCRLSAQSGAPLAMHLAETVEELELLASHSGPLMELLGELNAWDPSAISRGIAPLDYLRELSTAARALVIHGNYLAERELAFLAEHRDRMSLVYCPRTHTYFGHGRYPLAKALALGVNVALGTDSRASNPDLSLFAEMRHVARTFPEISPVDILRFGTLNGANALGIEERLGSLTPGMRAHLCVVPLPDHAAKDPHELLFGEGAGPEFRLDATSPKREREDNPLSPLAGASGL